MSILMIIILAVTLSMDAFSISLIYGTLGLRKSMQINMSIMVGLFHFFMPILGYKVGELILSIIKIDPKILVGIIFIILGIEMILSIKQEDKIKVLAGILSMILFSLTVSIDSFSIGISFGITKTNIILSCLIFSLISSAFTYIGLILGKKLSSILGNISIIIGATILIVLGINYLT